MEDVYCPMCNGRLVALQCAMVLINREPHRLAVSFPYAAVCTNCSLVSELSTEGRFIDLGNITLRDVDAPFTPGMYEPRVFIQSGSTLLRRRDS